jgi:hypothetical protein
MNDAAPIRRCSGALRAGHLLLPPPDPTISNREALRLEINVTHTKQTTRPHSNREGEALFLNRVRAVNCLLDCHGIDSARRYIARAVNRLCDCGRIDRLRDCHGIDSARPSIAQRAKTNLPEPGIHKTPPSSITEFNKRFRKRGQKTPSLRVSVRKKSAERFQSLTQILIERMFRLEMLARRITGERQEVNLSTVNCGR